MHLAVSLLHRDTVREDKVSGPDCLFQMMRDARGPIPCRGMGWWLTSFAVRRRRCERDRSERESGPFVLIPDRRRKTLHALDQRFLFGVQFIFALQGRSTA